jgi:hypothetical protein
MDLIVRTRMKVTTLTHCQYSETYDTVSGWLSEHMAEHRLDTRSLTSHKKSRRPHDRVLEAPCLTEYQNEYLSEGHKEYHGMTNRKKALRRESATTAFLTW